MADTAQLTAKELDALNADVCHEVLGAKIREEDLVFEYWHHDGYWDWVPNYAGDIRMTWAMEEIIERQGLQHEYLRALWQMTITPTASGKLIPTEQSQWAFFHATPEMRCRAALTAVRAAKQEEPDNA